MAFLFLICAIVSSIIEKQEIIAAGSEETTVMEQLTAYTRMEVTDPINTASQFLNATGETIEGIWKMLMWQHSFFEETLIGEVMWYFFMAVTVGLLFTIGLAIGGIIRGGS